MRSLIDSETAAVMLEPIQSMAGVREAPPHFFIELRELCNANGVVMIFDEVQTGIGRTGNWFFGGSENAGNIIPDVITLAKSLGSGIPVGACIVTQELSDAIKLNDLGTTFGGGMLAMAAVNATLEAIETDGMMANASKVETHLRAKLAGVNGVKAIHGKGCLLGIEFADACADIHSKLLNEHMITGTSSDPNVLRLLPPLMLPLAAIDRLVEVVAR